MGNPCDALLCVFSGTGVFAPSLKYAIYCPSSIGLDAQYAGMTANPMLQADEQAFSPGVGLASLGKAGGSADVGFHAQVVVKTNSNIALVNVSRLPDTEAAKAAALL
jgi:hypothetical protein